MFLQRFYLLLFFCGFLFFSHQTASAQTLYSISGTIRSAANGETLIGAGVFIPATGKGAATNTYGFYSISVPAGTYKIQFSFLGYQTVIKDITVTGNTRLNVDLPDAQSQLKEVVIEGGTSLEEKLVNNQMSIETISAKEAKLLPALFGEVDIIKTLQLKPGVQSGGEGSSGLYVRGGGPDQNLILLDEATVYNASHLFGFFSIFNSDAVKSVDLYKGDFPAQYGGRLSSVLDVKLRDGNNKKYAVSGGLGLISSRLTVEGPIQKDKSSFIISGRRTYADVFTRMINKANENNKDFEPIPDYYFYDLNAKANFQLGDKDRLYFSGYFGKDVFGFNDKNFNFDFNWGNYTGTARWNHLFSPKLFANTTFTASKYEYEIANQIDVFDFSLGSDITDYSFKTDLDYLFNDQHSIRFGAAYAFHNFGVGRLKAGSSDNTINFGQTVEYTGADYAAYVSDDFKVNPLLDINYGLRVTGFTSGGQSYFGLEPRLSGRYKLSEKVSVKASYARMMQYVHLVTNSGATLPTDIWYPSNKVVKPQASTQVAGGISKLLGDGKFLITNEAYYKWMNNQVDFREGAQLFVNPNLDEEFIFGKGYSYGNEIYLEKTEGKTTGWVGYTLSWTWREFPDIMNGERFPTRYDRRHDISVVAMHELTERIMLTGTFVFGTGNATTLPLARIPFQDQPGSNPDIIPVFAERNSYRMVPYHRMDLGFVYKLQPKWGESDITLSIYNLYNRRNPYLIYFEEIREEYDNAPLLGFKAKQISLFPVIPSITYNFKF